MSTTAALIRLCRPHQYVKNVFVFLPLFFGWRLADPGGPARTLLAFAGFCLASGAVYIFNDIRDRDADRAHPVKKNRPLAAGTVTVAQASILALALAAGGAAIALALPGARFAAILFGYLLLNLAYSLGLKHLAILDIACIGVGFVLRVFAGGAAAGIEPSHWIVLMTFLLALFLGLAKRRDDLLLAANGAATGRKSLDGYNLEFVSLAMGIMAAVVIVSYILYTLSPEVIAKHGTDRLYLTAFFVVVGILRYLQITFVEEKSGSPTQVLLKDLFIQAAVILWIISCYLILYVGRHAP